MNWLQKFILNRMYNFTVEGVFSISPLTTEEEIIFKATDEETGKFTIVFSENIRKPDLSVNDVIGLISDNTKKKMLVLLKNGNNEIWYRKLFNDELILSRKYLGGDEELAQPLSNLRYRIEEMIVPDENYLWTMALWDTLLDDHDDLFPIND